MDDYQFGGRTDDDLFADEFEPVAPEPEPTPETTKPQAPAPQHEPNTAPAQPQPAEPSQAAAAPVPKQPATTAPQAAAPSAHRGLGQSRHAHSNAQAAPTTAPAAAPRQPRQRHKNGPKNNNNNTVAAAAPSNAPANTDVTSSSATATATSSTTPSTDEPSATTDTPEATTNPTPPANAPSAPRNDANANAAASATAKPDREARLKSGANPRTKLTEAELAAKMEQMRILSAEKTRRFEKAQRDESDHAVAYAKGMEEARKRRAEEAEKRRRGEEERRRMDDEREKNRERKLAAQLGRRDAGGWDLGRDHEDAVGRGDEDRGFRSAHGGVRGAVKSGGLGGSRFAVANEEDGSGGRQFGERREFDGGRGGRGRGRGRGGRGRGGLFDDRAGEERRDGGDGYNNSNYRTPAPQKPPVVDDFPALPLPNAKKTEVSTKTPLPPLEALTPLSPQVGGWDDEMAAMDAKQES
ncbi:hypothetical protein GE09DRAFT_1195333 [Coniochaeta sp. 2T2.1]|nr:hypothetical protein GE09DRAFT_1195333 [Coniochaeta sp. 2T2.1]